MDPLLIVILAGGVAGGIGYLLGRSRQDAAPVSPQGAELPEKSRRLYAAANALAPFFNASAHPSDLIGNPEFEAGLGTAGSLLDRLRGRDGRTREHYPRDLVGRLGQQVYLLDAA